MEVHTHFRHPAYMLIASFKDYARDLGKTLQALGVFGPLFLLLAVAEGVFPVLTLHALGVWFDAVLGARAVGAVTSDLTDATRMVIGYFAVSAVTTGVSEVLLGGRAREVLRALALAASIFVVLVLTAPVLLFLLLGLALIVLAVLSIAHVKARSAMVLVFATLFMSQIFWHMSKLVMVRAYTAGESLSILLLSCGVFIVGVFLTLPTYENRR
ncbi:hypothetical protein KBC55_03705 [Patescibacteria group bacterium]|nr:hypothetical protein [Patescibacteria group bacterium]